MVNSSVPPPKVEVPPTTVSPSSTPRRMMTPLAGAAIRADWDSPVACTPLTSMRRSCSLAAAWRFSACASCARKASTAASETRDRWDSSCARAYSRRRLATSISAPAISDCSRASWFACAMSGTMVAMSWPVTTESPSRTKSRRATPEMGDLTTIWRSGSTSPVSSMVTLTVPRSAAPTR